MKPNNCLRCKDAVVCRKPLASRFWVVCGIGDGEGPQVVQEEIPVTTKFVEPATWCAAEERGE